MKKGIFFVPLKKGMGGLRPNVSNELPYTCGALRFSNIGFTLRPKKEGGG